MIKGIIIICSILLSAPSAERPVFPQASIQKKGQKSKKQLSKENPPAASKAIYGKYEFIFKTLEGRTFGLKQFGGRTTLVNIWAPWCEPCKKETEGLVRIYNYYHSMGFEVIGIAVQTTPDEVRKFVNALNVKWPVGINDEIIGQYKPVGIPASYLFDSKGSLIREFVGYADEKALDAVLSEIFRGPKAEKR